MNKLLAVFFALVLPSAASAAGQQRTIYMQPPGWVLPFQPGTPFSDSDFANGRFWTQGRGYSDSGVSSIRTSVALTPDSSGVYWNYIASGSCPAGQNGTRCAARVTNLGIMVEEARTNSALWSRDMTQVGSWAATGIGTALNAVGIDNAANSATTLTATGTAGVCTASCTILQAITLASSADSYSVFLKRVTGNGAVNITLNNLTNTTACTLVTTAFTRCTIVATTLANPTIGIQMTTVNDVIVADFNQLEVGASVSSPILTTNATAGRSTDVVTQPTSIGTNGFSFFVTATSYNPLTTASTTWGTISTGATANEISFFRVTTTGRASYIMLSGNVTQWNVNIVSPVIAQNALTKLGASVLAGTQNGILNGTTAPTAGTGASLPINPTIINVGSGAGGTGPLYGFVSRIVVAVTPVPISMLQAFTTLNRFN